MKLMSSEEISKIKKITELENPELVDINSLGDDDILILDKSAREHLVQMVEDNIHYTQDTRSQARILLHDINNYIFVASTSIELIAKLVETTVDERVHRAINRCTKNINNLIDYVKEYSNILAKETEGKVEYLDVEEIFHDLELMFADELSQHNIQFKYQMTNAGKLQMNKVLFLQCLVNLMKNAIEHVQKHERPWIKIIAKDKTIYFENSGRFVEDCDIDLIFKKNYSTRSKTSRGLGLYFVKNTLEKYNVDISIDKERGVCFKMVFP